MGFLTSFFSFIGSLFVPFGTSIWFWRRVGLNSPFGRFASWLGVPVIGLVIYVNWFTASGWVSSGDKASEVGDYATAIQHYDKAIALEPKEIEAYYSRAIAYGDIGDYDKAVEGFGYVIQKSEEMNAKDEYEYVSKFYNKHTGSLHRRAIIHYKAGRYALAIQDLSRLIERNKNNPEYLSHRCWLYAITGQLDPAIEDCNASMEWGRGAGYFDRRAFAYLKLGSLDDALKDYEAALAIKPFKMSHDAWANRVIEPGRATMFLGRGIVRRRSGDVDGGNADIEAAKKIDGEIVEKFARWGVSAY